MKEKATELTHEQAVVNIAYTACLTEDPLETMQLAYQFLEFLMTRESSRKRAVPTKKKVEPTKKPVKAVAPKKGSSKPPTIARKSKPWTQDEKDLMMKLRASGLSINQISKKIQRTKAATQVAISKLEKQYQH